jgi:hypothetical protein
VTMLTPAERILHSLGITEPGEIDLEAIGFHLGIVRIKYRPLDGCEARIAGSGDRAIITVDDKQPRRRQRFSIGHEIGHWHHHRGRTLFCEADHFSDHRHGQGMEQTANRFASNLLLPGYLLGPFARNYPHLTVKAVREVADVFDASLSATAIRLVEYGHSPCMLVCHGMSGRKWFIRSPGVPDRWFPQDTLHPDGYAIDLLQGARTEQPSPRKIGADAWFDRREAGRFEVQEQSFVVGAGEVVTIINFIDDEMLEERDARSRWR